MRWEQAAWFLLAVTLLSAQNNASSPGTIHERLAHLAIDAHQIYRVRDVRLNRGGVKIYLNEGVLAFTQPVEGRTVAAVFTTRGVEGGDGEVLALPPTRSERTSLTSYTKRPNLNDHFGTAVFFFSDRSVDECLAQLADPESRKAPDLAADLQESLNPLIQNLYPDFDLNLVEALLDQHKPEQGFFYGVFGGRDLGPFHLVYDPTLSEPITIGQLDVKSSRFQLWTSFRPNHAAPEVPQGSRFRNYRIDTKIADSLKLSVKAQFGYLCDENDGRSLRFGLSDHLHVTAATIDNQPVDFFQRRAGAFLIAANAPLTAGWHEITVNYEGEVIHRTKEQTYFVEERSTWYPHAGTTAAVFDLTFECPAALRLVSTGELVSDVVEHGVRRVHRRTAEPENIAGFNLGDYRTTETERSPYRIEVFANRLSVAEEELGPQTASILATYSRWWSTLPFHTIALTPISGYFGQGFPGLLYLSEVTYQKETSRPSALRNPRLDSFFSDMLLPHEVAHQWWGNLVLTADYRAGWLTEAMATHSALEYVEQHSGRSVMDAVLEEYKRDLNFKADGRTIESLGPVDFGSRLIDASGKDVWHTITYEKGAFILRMLQARLGAEGWRQLQLSLLKEFASRPVSNDEFRQVAARYVPAEQPDRDLQLFFETWVYSTGLPRLALSKQAGGWELEVSEVPDDFNADVPLSCHARSGGAESTRWIRATPGTNVLPASENGRVCRLPRADEFLYLD